MMEPTPHSQLPPWLHTPLQQLLAQQGHAMLVHGPSGLGQYDLALAYASARLCDTPAATGQACGQCPSCHNIQVRSHPDLRVVMPETEMLRLQWPLGEKAQAEIDDKKRKASKEIRIDALRDAVEFAQRTSARAKGKVVLVYPAEAMNAIAANALLKTLEEPAGQTIFVLASDASHQLLPTIRSRCMALSLGFPAAAQGQDWLSKVGQWDSATAQVWWMASGARPQDALELHAQGISAAQWQKLPKSMAAGELALVRDWPIKVLVESFHKLCHDQMALCVGAAPRFFTQENLCPDCALNRLVSWSRSLAKTLETVDHPYNAGLMLESLVARAQNALQPGTGRRI